MNTEWTLNTRPVRVTVDAATARPPGRGASWSAEFGQWRTVGKTEREALQALTDGMAALLAEHRRPVVVAYGGYTTVVSVGFGVGGPIWLDEVYGPNGYCVSSSCGDGWDLAVARARYSLAQRSTDWHTDASVHAAAAFVEPNAKVDRGQYGPEQIYDYAAWQRAAKDAMDAGRAEWHDWASTHRHQFAVIRPNA